MFAIKYVLSFSIEDSPEDVLIQLERYVHTYFRIFIFFMKLISVNFIIVLIFSPSFCI
jgi:hypothetical protein